MISENMSKRLARQLNRELYSAYLYFGMASYAASAGLKGFENWFVKQVKEELEHAKRFYDYITGQGRRPMMEAIEAPPQDFSSGQALFEKTLSHEKKVTSLIKELVKVAELENDKGTLAFLEWFTREQVEEEATPARILENIRASFAKKDGILSVDAVLAARK